MIKVTKFTDKQGAEALEYIGCNLLSGIELKAVCRETGGHPEYKNWKTKYDSEAYKLITAPTQVTLRSMLTSFLRISL